MNIIAPRLRKGAGIGVVAPAGPITQPELQSGLDLIESYGFHVLLAPHIYDRESYLAGKDETRLNDFHAMLRNKDIQAILCARGGYGSLRLLDKIDFDLIRKNPKIIVGYSDITALLLAVYHRTRLVTFHGPLVKDLAGERVQDLEFLLQMITSNGLFQLDLAQGEALVHGKAKGFLLGGNLTLICHLLGTPFMPSMKGAILFIEEKGEPLYRIDRLLTQLRLCGQLDHIKGLIVGNFQDCADIASINHLVLDILAGFRIPICAGLPIGHGMQNIPLPIGLPVIMDTQKLTVVATESCLSA
jgi:muramoyltetrapeptide carboxypeptidase